MINITQIHEEAALLKSYDGFIVASGFEDRCSHQSTQFRGTAIKKYALGFKNEAADAIRLKNDLAFEKLGFKTVLVAPNEDIERLFFQLLQDIRNSARSKDSVAVYIDYSSMTKNWYASFLHICDCAFTELKLTLTFGYSHALYVKFDGKNAFNSVVQPIKGFCNLSVPTRPTAVVIGLGNEPNRIYGLKEYFDAVPFLFYTDRSYNPEFSEEIELLNEEFLSSIKSENIIKYPIFDLTYTAFLLENLCKRLLSKHRVVIAPCGPKPFALLAMITSLKYKSDIEVWRISPGEGLSKVNRIAAGLVSCIEVSFIEK